MSSSTIPRVVSAGVPIRRPDACIGGRWSNGIALRLTVMPTSARRSSASLPLRPSMPRSTSTRCTSVPPVSTSRPPSWSVSPNARAFAIVWRWRSRNASLAAIRRHTALAAMTCSSGPPCWPGNTALSIACAYSSLHRIRPARGPPSVLWVVVVTTSACGTGLGCSPAATRPAKCAMSTNSFAPTSSAMRRNSAKSRWRGYADQPATITFGRCSLASRSTCSMSTR